MADTQFQEFVNLSGIYQTVAAHQIFILAHWGRYIVEMVHADQGTALHVEQSGIAQLLTDELVVGWYQHLDGVFRRIFES